MATPMRVRASVSTAKPSKNKTKNIKAIINMGINPRPRRKLEVALKRLHHTPNRVN
jgi:hypothetical protein